MTGTFDPSKLSAREKLDMAEEHEDDVLTHCPECSTAFWKPDMESAVEAAEDHDANLHDGQPTTKVAGIVPPQFSDDEQDRIQKAVERVKDTVESRRTRGED